MFTAPKKILLIIDGLPVGGVERQLVELLKGFQSSKNYALTLGIFQRGGEMEKEALAFANDVLYTTNTKPFSIIPFFQIPYQAKKNKIDLIHTFGCFSDIIGVITKFFFKIPLINGSIRSARPRLNHRDIISRLCMISADMIVANSYAGLDAFRVQKQSNTSVIYNGVDLKRFKNLDSPKFKHGSICMVGNFTKKKDQKSLIQALPIILKEFPRSHLLLIGRGKTLASCKSIVSSLKLDNYVKFIVNTIKPEKYIAKCDVGVLISPNGEGLSNAILEYMALGKPVIASKTGGNCELIEHGKTGLLIPDNTPKLIADSILKLLHNPQKAAKMVKNGKNFFHKKFDVKRMVYEYKCIYKKILHQSASR